MRRESKRAVRAVAFVAAGLFSLQLHAQQSVQLDLPAQPLAESLRQLAFASNTNIVFDPGWVSGMNAPAFSGTATAEEVLVRLLSGTQLRYKFVDDKTVSLMPPSNGTKRTAAGKSSLSAVKTEGRPRLAQLDGASSSGSESSPGGATNHGVEDSSKSFDRDTLEEIVVTAQKREERLIDVPISIVALSAEQLQKRDISSIDDLREAVPGLAIVNNGGFQRRIMLRGVSNTFGSGSLVGMYLDEAAVTPNGPASELDLQTYDLERVEVLLGPQGTLYGAGSAGGTIRFITKDPDLERLATNVDLTASFTEDGEPGQKIAGTLNVPLIENELGLRIAGTFDRQGGWMDQPAANKKDINDQEIANVRVKGLWQPTSRFSLGAMAVIHRNDGAMSQSEARDGTFTQVLGMTSTPAAQDDYEIYNLTLSYDFASFRLLSATSYIATDKKSRDWGTRPLLLPEQRFEYYYFQHASHQSMWTEEIRLMSQGSGPWEWTVGGFYRYVESEMAEVLAGPFTPALGIAYSVENAQSKSGALFGDVSYQLSPRIKLGAGLRYFEDDVENQNTLGFGAPVPLGPPQAGSFDSLNPRVYLQYKFTDDVNAYASVAKGFRSGGFNSVTQPTYGPETLWTYELGTKMSLADGRVSTDLVLFFSEYTDYQVRAIAPALGESVISNAGDAEIKGVEWRLTWRPTDHWHLGVNGSYTSSELVEIDALSPPLAVGDDLDLVPKYGVTLSAEREWSWSGRPGFARLDYSQQGRSTYRNRSIGPWYFGESDVIKQLNFNSSVQWNDSLSFGLFAENLLNERGQTSAFGNSDDIAPRLRPRTFGIQFGVRFD